MLGKQFVCYKKLANGSVCEKTFMSRQELGAHVRWQHPKVTPAALAAEQLAPSLRRLLGAIEEYAAYNPDRFAAEGVPKNSLLNFLVGKTGKKKKDLLEIELKKLDQAGYTRTGMGTVFILNKKALKLRPARQPANYDYYVDSDLFVFGLEEKFTLEELKKVYRRKVKILHPDVGGEAEPFESVHAAYERLRRRN